MSLIDVDSWLIEYEACESLQHTILTLLRQREKRQRLSPEYNRSSAAIQFSLNQLENELQQLKEKLDGVNARTITNEQLQRRRRQLDSLKSQFIQLQIKFLNETRNTRSEMLQNDQPPLGMNTTSSLRGGDYDVQLLKQQQINILEDQNRGLEVLSQTITRQRALAETLGQEVDEQNGILDNLTNTMETVDSRINVETDKIGIINRRDNTCRYWVVIVLLFIAIIAVGTF